MVAYTIVPVVIRTPLRLQVQVHGPQNLFSQFLFFQQVPDCTAWSRPAPAHSPNQCPQTGASPSSRRAPLPPPGPTGCTTAAKSKSAAFAPRLPAADRSGPGIMRLHQRAHSRHGTNYSISSRNKARRVLLVYGSKPVIIARSSISFLRPVT